ncbi:MAG: long-chain-fatty-acid--CoA ligase [Alphaproteobacteria bacterium]|nr:long-chain-fatty-acid--CoA ligase [Alphaproteobacteria bacterium]
MHLTASIKRAMVIAANKVATIDGERVHTWAECGERVARLAGALQDELRLADGGRAAILSLNNDRYFEFSHAMPWAGGVFVPVNTRLAPPEIRYWLEDSGSELLFVDDTFAAVASDLKAELPELRELIYIGDGETPAGMANYEELVAAAGPAEDAVKGYDDLAALYYTGGTTGTSKGVMLSHRNLVSNALHIVPIFDFHEGMRWLHAAPMFHIADGLSIFGATMVGGHHIFISGFEPGVVLRAIEEHRITNCLLVPTMVNMLVHHPEIEAHDLSSLRRLVYGASPMPEAVIRRAVEVMPHVEFTHAYGQTECAPLVTSNGPDAHRGEGLERGLFKSCGRPVMDVEVKIVDEAGAEVGRGAVGELCARGPNVMLGYWNKPEQTAEALREGWMHSGDGAYMDEDGYVYIVDRVKDMIITGGENVYSAEVESTVHLHPAVAECAVIGVPDDTWGERVHAVVRLKAEAEASADEIVAHCHQHIAGFKCPRSVEIRSEPLPLSGAGKILKTELRKPHWEGEEKQVH